MRKGLRANMRREVINVPQTGINIVKQIKRAIDESQPAAKVIGRYFSNDVKKLARQLYQYCQKQIYYEAEPAAIQTAKTLPRIVHDREGDCKHYTVVIASILKAKKIPFRLRMISQSYFNKEPTHIYVVAYGKRGQEIIVDPCMFFFNDEARFTHKYDYKV